MHNLLTNTKKNWVAAVTGNTKSCFKGMGKWGSLTGVGFLHLDF
jgi:hypothetical protein